MSDELRFTRLEDKVDRISESVTRMEEQQKNTYNLLIQHDKKGVRALEKAEALEDRMDANEAMWKVPLKYLTLFGKISAAVAAIFGVYKMFGK